MKLITKREELGDFTGIVIFSAPWCGPCKTYKPALERFGADFQIETVQVDIDQSRELAGAYTVRAVPTTVFFRGGEPIRQAVGAQTNAALERLVAP